MVLYLNLIFEAVLQVIWLQEFNYGSDLRSPLRPRRRFNRSAPLLVAGLALLVLIVLGGGALSVREASAPSSALSATRAG